MKKLILAVLTAALMSIGLVGVSTTSANAACSPTRYTGCTNTSTSATVDRDERGRPVALSLSVDSTSNVKANGTITVTVTTPRKFFKKKNGKKKRSPKPAVLGTTTAVYNGGAVTAGIPVPTNRPGTYTVTITYTSPTPSAFNGSTVVTTFKVVKNKKK